MESARKESWKRVGRMKSMMNPYQTRLIDEKEPYLYHSENIIVIKGDQLDIQDIVLQSQLPVSGHQLQLNGCNTRQFISLLSVE